MSPLAKFFHLLLREGRVSLREPEPLAPAANAEVAEVLRQAFADHRLDVAGPVVELDEATAWAAARLLHQACWALVSHALPPAELEKCLVMPGLPRSPAQHLSADLLLRYLPQVYRRARALDPADPLGKILENVLRRWPLSGVLADIDEGPLTPPDFGGHLGLMLLYAERLARHERSAWLPTGPGREYVALVWAELGKDTTLLERRDPELVSQEHAGTGNEADE